MAVSASKASIIASPFVLQQILCSFIIFPGVFRDRQLALFIKCLCLVKSVELTPVLFSRKEKTDEITGHLERLVRNKANFVTVFSGF